MRIEREARRRTTVGLAPLIDVVFLLLVFFMLASTFLRYSGFDLSGGRSGAVQNADIGNLVLVRVKGAAGLDINGKAVSLHGLAGELAALSRPEGLRVAVKPIGGATVQHVVDVIEKLRTETVRDVTIVR